MPFILSMAASRYGTHNDPFSRLITCSPGNRPNRLCMTIAVTVSMIGRSP